MQHLAKKAIENGMMTFEENASESKKQQCIRRLDIWLANSREFFKGSFMKVDMNVR